MSGIYAPIEYLNVLQSIPKSMPILTDDNDGVESDSGDSMRIFHLHRILVVFVYNIVKIQYVIDRVPMQK